MHYLSFPNNAKLGYTYTAPCCNKDDAFFSVAKQAKPATPSRFEILFQNRKLCNFWNTSGFIETVEPITFALFGIFSFIVHGIFRKNLYPNRHF